MEKRTAQGTLDMIFYLRANTGCRSQDIKIDFSGLKDMLKKFYYFYMFYRPASYELLRYCVDYSYYRNDSTNWSSQKRNVIDCTETNKINSEIIGGIYYILEAHLFDKGVN